MSWAAFLGGFLGAVVAAPLGLTVIMSVAWKAAQKLNATTVSAPSVIAPQPEPGLRLVKPEDEQGSAS